MHDETAQGNDFFKCDFCMQPWSDDRPMVEGHRGSLICGSCLTVALQDMAHNPDGRTCTLCLEARDEPCWVSPLRDDVIACRTCIKRSAGILHKDPDSPWTKPA